MVCGLIINKSTIHQSSNEVDVSNYKNRTVLKNEKKTILYSRLKRPRNEQYETIGLS